MSTPSTTNLIQGINNIDFEGIKANLVRFLRDNNDFPDAIYTGSAFNTLLDVLAYNTHYNMLYSSFTLNEAFLDSCSKYSSAVSIAKGLGYVPYSATAAKLHINRISASDSTIIPPGASIFASHGDQSYTFTTLDAVVINSYNSQSGRYESAAPFSAYHGKLIEENVSVKSITRTGVYSNVKALISNRNCDLSTLEVRTIDPVTGDYTVWTPAGQYTTIGPYDKVYFTRMREDLYYEIYFGDGVVGATPTNSSSPQDYITISLKYVAIPNVDDQPEKINPSTVVLSRGMDNTISYVTYVDPIVPFTAGSAIESIESIKFHAPKNYISQNRAVTESDYATIITQKFPWIESVSVWGGENHSPPRYGAVFINVKPRGRLYTVESEKNQIVQYLKRGKAMMSITPIVIDPSYTRILVDSTITIDAKKIAASVGAITSTVNDAIYNYVNNLHLSNSKFRIGELTAEITASTHGIVSNDTNIRLQQTISTIVGIASKYDLNIENPISVTAGSVMSDKFTISGSDKLNYISNENEGILILNTIESNGVVSSKVKIGVIDHKKGIISIDPISITETMDTTNKLTWTIVTGSRDINPIRNMILTTDSAAIQLSFDVINSNVQNGIV